MSAITAYFCEQCQKETLWQISPGGDRRQCTECKAEQFMNKPAPHNFPHYIKIERHGGSPLGVLSVASVPFEIKRVYWIGEVGDLTHWKVLRGGHAHHRCQQVFYCLKGRVEIACDNGRGRYFVRSIDQRVPEALFVPAMNWHTMTYRKGSICMAVASEPYDEKEYIRSREEFEMLVATKRAQEAMKSA